jgi:hypothetical protein
MADITLSSGFTINSSNNPEQAEEAFGRLVLFLNQPEPCIICIACRYALNPSAEAVSKHLWSVYETPPTARKGLNRMVKSLQFTNPSTLPVRYDGSTVHPYLTVLNRAVCKVCDFRMTSLELIGRVVNWLLICMKTAWIVSQVDYYLRAQRRR